MTRKDYELIAAAIAAVARHNATDDDYREGWHGATSAASHRLADSLASTNPRFDRSRFLKACGLEA